MSRRVLDSINAAALLVLGSVTFVSVGPAIEDVFPVVEPFVVETQRVDGRNVEIHGWLETKRECRFVEVVGIAHRRGAIDLVIPIEFSETKGVGTARPLGVQGWGPWKMVVPADTLTVDLVGYHRCHLLWESRTKLTRIDLLK